MRGQPGDHAGSVIDVMPRESARFILNRVGMKPVDGKAGEAARATGTLRYHRRMPVIQAQRLLLVNHERHGSNAIAPCVDGDHGAGTIQGYGVCGHIPKLSGGPA